MKILPRYLLPVGFSSQVLKSLDVARNACVLPRVNDRVGLAEAIKACPLSVAVISPDWPHKELKIVQTMLLDHAVACVVATELDPVWLESAIESALAERSSEFESILLNQLLALIPDIVYFKDRHGRFLTGNHELARSYNLEDPALLIGRSDADFLLPEFWKKTFSDEQLVMLTEQPVIGLEERAIYEGNRVKWWRTWKAPLRDRSGRVIGTFGFSREETTLKNTESALETERNLLDVLLNGFPDSIYIKDLNGRFLLANQVVANRCNVPVASLKGKSDLDFYPREEAEASRKDEVAIMTTGMPLINREERLRTLDGREIYILTTKLPYRNAEGEIIGIVGMGRNITLRKKYDEQMQAAQEEIAALRAELSETAELRAEIACLKKGSAC